MPDHEAIKSTFDTKRQEDKTAAIRYLAGEYGILSDHYTLTVVEYDVSASKHARTNGGKGETSEDVTVRINEPYFDRQVQTDEGYNKLIHTVGHEFQHVNQRRVDGWRGASTKEEREFLAYSWELLEATAAHEIPELIRNADSRAKTIRKMKNNYMGMDEATRRGYEDRAKELNKEADIDLELVPVLVD